MLKSRLSKLDIFCGLTSGADIYWHFVIVHPPSRFMRLSDPLRNLGCGLLYWLFRSMRRREYRMRKSSLKFNESKKRWKLNFKPVHGYSDFWGYFESDFSWRVSPIRNERKSDSHFNSSLTRWVEAFISNYQSEICWPIFSSYFSRSF